MFKLYPCESSIKELSSYITISGGLEWKYTSSEKMLVKKNTKFDSDFILSRIAQTQSLSQIVCMYLEENSKIGYHQAVVLQLFLVVNGEGVVRGNSEEEIRVNSGDAVFWNKGEWHETKTETGLTAIVIECEALDISSLIAL